MCQDLLCFLLDRTTWRRALDTDFGGHRPGSTEMSSAGDALPRLRLAALTWLTAALVLPLIPDGSRWWRPRERMSTIDCEDSARQLLDCLRWRARPRLGDRLVHGRSCAMQSSQAVVPDVARGSMVTQHCPRLQCRHGKGCDTRQRIGGSQKHHPECWTYHGPQMLCLPFLRPFHVRRKCVTTILHSADGTGSWGG